MVPVLITLSSALILMSNVPYVINIIRGKTKPRIVSWINWSLIATITGAATLADKQYPTTVLMLFCALGTATVVVLGWRHGDKKISRMDALCLFGALIGVGVWLTLQSLTLAVITMVTVDFLGSIPTLVHSWRQPQEETWVTYLMSAVAGVCTLLVLQQWKVTSVLPPVYLLVINAIFTAIIISRLWYTERW